MKKVNPSALCFGKDFKWVLRRNSWQQNLNENQLLAAATLALEGKLK